MFTAPTILGKRGAYANWKSWRFARTVIYRQALTSKQRILRGFPDDTPEIEYWNRPKLSYYK